MIEDSGYELTKGWSIIAAGNREKDRSVTHRMPSALANSFVHIDFTVDFDEWLFWAVEVEIAPELTAFLHFRPVLLHDFDSERSSKAFPAPRSWEFASGILKISTDPDIFSELLAGTVGTGAAKEFSGFMKIWQDLPEIEDIIENPEGIDIPTDPAVLFAGRLPDEFSVLLVREAVRHCNELTGLDDFAGWAAKHADVLV